MIKKAAILPIFDRLVDENISENIEPDVKRYITLEELQASVVQDVSRLLNTKITGFWETYTQSINMPFNYGISSSAYKIVESVFDVRDLENSIQNVIAEFEPRLTNLVVQVSIKDELPGQAQVMIHGDVLYGEYRIPLSFPVRLELS